MQKMTEKSRKTEKAERTIGGPVLVTGATGGQGGAVARALLARGWPVRALVRDPHSRAARELAALGAQPVAGDLDDLASLRAAARGVYGLFSVQPADLASPDPEQEVRRGRNLVDAAGAEGVKHLVYSSVAAVGRGSGVAHFGSKARIEAHIGVAGVPATVLRPVFFMENWTYMTPDAVNGERVGHLSLGPDTPLQMIALADIGRIAADVFGDPAASVGLTTEIAGDELTVRQIAEALGRSDGIPTRFERREAGDPGADVGDMAAMFAWLDRSGYQADIAGLRARFPGLLTFEAWLRANGSPGVRGRPGS